MTGPAVLRLRDLPPAKGDAGLAALLVLDLATALTSPAPRHAVPRTIGDPVRPIAPVSRVVTADAIVTDGEGFGLVDGFDAAADSTRDGGGELVIGIAELALTRYLGRSPWPTRPTSAASAAIRRRQPAAFGDLPAPFRRVFICMLSSRTLFRFDAADLARELGEAFAALGVESLADARRRLARATTLARAFVPAEAPSAAAAHTPAFAPAYIRPAAEVRRRRGRRAGVGVGRLRRAVLIATVFLVSGGVAGGAYAAVASNSASGRSTPETRPSPARPAADVSSAGGSASTPSTAPTTNPTPAASSSSAAPAASSRAAKTRAASTPTTAAAPSTSTTAPPAAPTSATSEVPTSSSPSTPAPTDTAPSDGFPTFPGLLPQNETADGGT